MQTKMLESDLHDDSSLVRNVARFQESLSRLEFMVAFLLEKNEQMRQKLADRSYQDRA